MVASGEAQRQFTGRRGTSSPEAPSRINAGDIFAGIYDGKWRLEEALTSTIRGDRRLPVLPKRQRLNSREDG